MNIKENINTWMYIQYMHSKTFMIDRFVVSKLVLT